MVPTVDEFLDGCCRWKGEHRGIGYELSWHGRSDHSPDGTWCWYLWLTSEQFYSDDWNALRLPRVDKQIFGQNWHRHWDYASFPDLEAHCRWTFGEMSVYLGKDGKEYEQIKIGCDYAHLWDREMGNPETRDSVRRDAKRSIDLLCIQYPHRRERCAYSGRYDDPARFYTAIGGQRVHLSCVEDLRKHGWVKWLPVS